MSFVVLALLGMTGSAIWSSVFRTPQQHKRLSAKERRLLISGGALWGAPKTERAPTSSPPNEDVPPTPGSNTNSLVNDLRQLFSQRLFKGLVVAQYAIASITWFFLAWFPAYLVLDLGLSLAEAGALSAFPAIGGFIGGTVAGVFSDRLLRRTHSLSIARKTPVYVGMSLVIVGFLACLFTRDPTWVAIFMTIAFFGKSVGTMIWTLVSDLAPANRVGLTGSVVNAFTNLSGIITPVLVGYAVALYGNFDLALWLVAGHAALAIAMNHWVMGHLQRMPDLQSPNP
jgi:ACS family glucarate transporter-like MFS transporter